MRYCPTCSARFDGAEDVCPQDGTPLEAFDRLIGTVVDGKYRIDELLGTGSMGAVYAATQLNLGRVVALKVIRDDVVVSRHAVERFRREAAAVARLKHPHIVTIFDSGVAPDVGAYTVMEHLEGCSLHAELKRLGTLPLSRAVELLQQVCSAVDAAHAVGVVHRDLKPQNIFLEKTSGGESAKVLDFGIAKLEGGSGADSASLTATGAMLGTPLYMSPEQCGDEPVDARADVYSLGCVFYEMVTGRPPFVGSSVTAVLVKQMSERPKPPSHYAPDLPRAVDALALRALAKSPAERHQTAAELGRALAALDLEGTSSSETRFAVPDDAPAGGRTTAGRIDESLGQLRATPHNLPQFATGFVERARAIGEIKDLLSTARALTLTGPGGVAKTHLAGQVASEVLDEFPDGVWFVEVAPLVSPAQLPRAVATVLGLPTDGRVDAGALAASLRGKRVLIVFDSCDHLAEACASLAADLLAACPDLRVLATSGRPLGVGGESVYRLASLSTGEFEDLANRVRSSHDGAPERSQEIARAAPPRRRAWLVPAAIALAAIALAAAAGLWLLPGAPTGIDSVAILPFANSSPDPDAEYLSDGITESIINELSHLPDLRVMARTTVFRYKGKEVDLEQIGRDLGVRAVLTGRVVQRGDVISIQAELVDVSSGSQIWGEQYNRKVSDVLAVQDDIARQISEKLSHRLTSDERQRLARHYTDDNEAYQAYLRGRFHLAKQTRDDWQKSVEAFDRAIALDPKYALAHAGLADAYVLASNVYLPPAEAMARARESARRALEIDEGLAEAHAALGQIEFWYEWDWEGAEGEYRRAIDLNPGYAAAHSSYGYALTALGRFDEGLAEMRAAQRLDPLSIPLNRDIGSALLFARRYDEAIEQYRRVVELDPTFSLVHMSLGTAYVLKGAHGEAFAEFDAAKEPDSSMQRLYTLGFAHAMAGNTAEARRILGTLDAAAARGEYLAPVAVARIHAALGENDLAFAWLEKAYASRADTLLWLKVDPRLDRLRSDPRYADLLRRLRLAA